MKVIHEVGYIAPCPACKKDANWLSTWWVEVGPDPWPYTESKPRTTISIDCDCE